MNQVYGTHPDVSIRHVHLRVADLQRATAFYRDVLGFAVTAYGPDHGCPARRSWLSGSALPVQSQCPIPRPEGAVGRVEARRDSVRRGRLTGGRHTL